MPHGGVEGSSATRGFVGAFIAWAALCAIVSATLPVADAAQRRASITFYRLNKLGQLYEVRIVRNIDEPGCHNFLKKTGVFRVGQVGFEYCEVFTEKACQPDSAVTATWNASSKRDPSKKYPTTRITRGNMWVLSVEDNVTLRSWHCAAAVAQD